MCDTYAIPYRHIDEDTISSTSLNHKTKGEYIKLFKCISDALGVTVICGPL